MDFAPSPRVEELRGRIAAFLDEHVYPVEMEALQALDDEVGPGVPYPRILVELRERFGADADPDEVYEEVTGEMQETLDDLADERTLPLVG